MKKSIVISLLTVTTLLCTALCSFASTGKVTTDTLRVRKEPSTDSSIVTLISINDEVEILGEENGWYKIQAGDKVGYVATKYINVLTEANKNVEKLNEDNQNSQNTAKENNQAEETKTEETQNTQVPENAETVAVIIAGEKIYITPLINSLVLETVTEEKKVEIISEINGWSYIKIETTSGWVRTENIQRKTIEKENIPNNETNNNNSSPKIGYISVNSVNFRKTANTSGEVISKLARNTKVTIIQKGDSWTEIQIGDNKGFVATEYISDTELETTSRSGNSRTDNNKNAETKKTETVSETKEVKNANPTQKTGISGESVVAYAKKYLGYKYVSGGASPKTGFDCSGFTTYVYKNFGISLNRTSGGQSSNGSQVSKNNLKPGDIICFSNSSKSKRIGHVGIYIGGGKFIHAANSKKGVIISNVTGAGFYFVTARRVI